MNSAAPVSFDADPGIRRIDIGIDVGSTTVKATCIDADTNAVVFTSYERHGGRQSQAAARLVDAIARRFGPIDMRAAVCGSGAQPIARAMGVPYVQEVVALSIATQSLETRPRCAIELGGQDAKIVFFREEGGELAVSDMRMNGSCAGGTGAFIDEMAAVLEVPADRFDELAATGTTVYDVSGRCGVYAKTDIQPLLNQGADRGDLALSCFHAIAKQVVGGLAQGMAIEAPVLFAGGPLTFDDTLVAVFKQRLGLSDRDVIRPRDPETFVSLGAALSLDAGLFDDPAPFDPARARRALAAIADEAAGAAAGRPLFASEDERRAFFRRHARAPHAGKTRASHAMSPVYLGIDAGSTTSKIAVVGEDGTLLDSFYGRNEGAPLDTVVQALRGLHERWQAEGARYVVAGVGTTGYGEDLCAQALHADCHVVETVAHAKAALHYVPDAGFVLDIGGQDMKALWIDHGVVSDIVLNEACSSGCGSFLENLAASLGMRTEDIAQAAFRSQHPAELGSRCTVFMNSSIITEQKNGRTPDDIMAGLCRSIVENVFTKVVRVANLDSLGPSIVVQGGTFENDAVLRALEQYIGRPVTRAPYPGLMGAIGAAHYAHAAADGSPSAFVGFDALEHFSYERRPGLRCPLCANHCSRTQIVFEDGSGIVMGNRCEKGSVVVGPNDAEAKRRLRELARRTERDDLFELRKNLLLRPYPCKNPLPGRSTVIGLPLVLSYWETLPFWSAFFRTLGFTVKISPESTRRMFERGLDGVTSDTICFPAKLVHGHVRWLAAHGVDRIFMPSVTTVPSENTEKTSQSMCAVVKGYPIVMRNSDNPARSGPVAFDTPLFHWYAPEDRQRQLARFMRETFGIDASDVRHAIAQGDAAQREFKGELIRHATKAVERARAKGEPIVVLGSRPYHNDGLVHHGIPALFREFGALAVPPDAVAGIEDVDLSHSRIDIVNNYHARMLSSAVVAACRADMEYAQIVSFGCGHDAYLSDEIARLAEEIGGKTPLVLKVDESDARGPLRIRIRSFLETAREQRANRRDTAPVVADPYPHKYTKRDRERRIVLVPNTSHAFCRLMSAVFSKQGIIAQPLDVGRERAIELGKRYVHNDICFPAQMTVGESLAALESGRYDLDRVAVATGKYIGDCRLTHYAALLRKALDDAGYETVPIITNDDVDYHDMHPGFRMSMASAATIAFGLPMIDVLEELLRAMRPYELEPGATQRAFDAAIDAVMEGIERRGIAGAKEGFARGIDALSAVRIDRSHPRPRVLIVGEYLLNFHPGANRDIEAYLERNGMEVVEARMTDVIRKTYFYKHAQCREYRVSLPATQKAWYAIADNLFELAHDACDRIARRHPLYAPACRMPELVQRSDAIFDHTFDAGEGVLIPAEILHHAERGCKAFIILQPFGCLPNHIVGRGIVKRLKEMHPDAHILALDYDPDVSFANIENRLQMLIMDAKRADRR